MGELLGGLFATWVVRAFIVKKFGRTRKGTAVYGFSIAILITLYAVISSAQGVSTAQVMIGAAVYAASAILWLFFNPRFHLRAEHYDD